MATFKDSEDDYRGRLEQIKLQKKENHKKLKAVVRCLERDGSMSDAELEYRIPIGDMEDLTEVARDEVPRNPCQIVEKNIGEERTYEKSRDGFTLDNLENGVREQKKATGGIELVREEAAVDVNNTDRTEEHMGTFADGLVKFFDCGENKEDQVSKDKLLVELPKEHELPSNKADYMRMSMAEKVRCYNFDTEGTEKAFDMVKTYFQSVGMVAGFDDIYEEATLLTDYCERLSAEWILNEKVEQILQKMDMLDINMEQISEYSVNVLSEVFGFNDVDYYMGIKLFSAVLNRKSISLEHQERYDLFEKIYEEGMRESRQKNRDGR